MDIFIIICTCINMYKIINIRCMYIYIYVCVCVYRHIPTISSVSSYPHYILCIYHPLNPIKNPTENPIETPIKTPNVPQFRTRC